MPSDLDRRLSRLLEDKKLPPNKKCELLKDIIDDNEFLKKLQPYPKKAILHLDSHAQNVNIEDIVTNVNLTMAAYAVYMGNDLELIKLLLEYGYNRSHALSSALLKKRKDVVRYIFLGNDPIDFQYQIIAGYTISNILSANPEYNNLCSSRTQLQKSIQEFNTIPEEKGRRYHPTWITLFTDACRDLSFVIDYLVMCLNDIKIGASLEDNDSRKKKEKDYLFLLPFTEELVHLTHEVLEDEQAYEQVKNNLLSIWQAYQPTLGGYFESPEALEKFLNRLCQGKTFVMTFNDKASRLDQSRSNSLISVKKNSDSLCNERKAEPSKDQKDSMEKSNVSKQNSGYTLRLVN